MFCHILKLKGCLWKKGTITCIMIFFASEFAYMHCIKSSAYNGLLQHLNPFFFCFFLQAGKAVSLQSDELNR